MNHRQFTLALAIRRLAERPHYYCEDEWYSCPAHVGGCANDNYPANICNCGADEHNAEVARLWGELLEQEELA